MTKKEQLILELDNLLIELKTNPNLSVVDYKIDLEAEIKPVMIGGPEGQQIGRVPSGRRERTLRIVTRGH